ncbi:MAG: serpin family protein [bacterium]|nr:serpin family protein [bacterium]
MQPTWCGGAARDELRRAIQCEINPDLLLDSLSRILATHKNDSIGKYSSDFVSATAIWKNKGVSLNKQFEKAAKRNDIELKKIDFEDVEDAERAIDDWASEHTKGKIRDVVNQNDLDGPPIVLAITNAVSAEAVWAVKFEKGNPPHFILADGTVTQVLTMQNQKDDCPYWLYGAFDDFSAIAMRSADTRLTIHIFLPDSGLPIQYFETLLSCNSWEQWQDSILPRKQKVEVFLPKFSFQENIDLIPVVKSLGVIRAFGGADFSNILTSLDSTSVWIRILKQTAVVKLEEDGFELMLSRMAIWSSWA